MAARKSPEVDKYTYRLMWSEEDYEYVGLCAEFSSLSWLAKSQTSALRGIRKLVGQVVKDLKRRRRKIPEPLALRSYSGRFVVRVPPHVHRMLVMEAAEAKVSLNRWVSQKLSS